MKNYITLILIFLSVSSLISQVSEVRWVIYIQESLVNEHGTSLVLEKVKNNYEFFEESITNGYEHWGLNLDPYLNNEYEGTQTLGIISVQILPDSLFGNSIETTSTYLSRFSVPDDEWYDNYSPDSIGVKFNQARVMYILDNPTTSTSGTGSTLGNVVRWTAVGGTNILSHEIAHNYFAKHATAVQLEDYVVSFGDTIAKPMDWTLDNGVGPYQAILSPGAIEDIMTEELGRGIKSASEFHPKLKISVTMPLELSVVAGDTVSLGTFIHESWVKTNPLIIIKNINGDTLLTSVHSSLELWHEIIIPSNSNGEYPISIILENEPTNESDSVQINFIVENATSLYDQDKISKESIIRLYPNPAFSQISIDLIELDSKPYRIKLYDLTKSLLHQQIIVNEPRVTMNVDNLVNGTYFVQIQLHNGRSVIEKLIINR